MKKDVIKELTKMKPNLHKFKISDKELWDFGNKLGSNYNSFGFTGDNLASARNIVWEAFDKKITKRSLELRLNRFKTNFDRLYKALKNHDGTGIWKVQNSKWSSKFVGFLFARGSIEAKKLSQVLYPDVITTLTGQFSSSYNYMISYHLVELTEDSSRIELWQTNEINSIRKEIDQTKSLIEYQPQT